MQEYMGVVRIFGGNFAPNGWKFCNGQLLSVSEYPALFALLGTTYGGDGQVNFALPDLRSRVAVGGYGKPGPGTSAIYLGEMIGTEIVTLTEQQMPAHNHFALVADSNATVAQGSGTTAMATPGATDTGTFVAGNGYNAAATDTKLSIGSTSFIGGNQPHNNIQPYLGMNYIICVEGLFPSRN